MSINGLSFTSARPAPQPCVSVHRCGGIQEVGALVSAAVEWQLKLTIAWLSSPAWENFTCNRVHLEATYGSLISSLPWDWFSVVDVSLLFLFEGVRILLESTDENNLPYRPYMQIWMLLISINKSSTKEMNPITQPSFRAVGQTHAERQTFEKPENKRQMYGI